MANTYDLTGRRFGRLLVIGRDKDRKSTHDTYWICLCDCGNTKSVTTGHLTAGTVKSCRCLRFEKSTARILEQSKKNIKHGEAGNHLYSIWHCMHERCENPNIPAFKYYGGKGVKVCEEWKDYKNFAAWARENGYVYLDGVQHGEKMSIDRIDSDGDYCPNNCRWITVRENCTRATKARWENARRSKGIHGTENAV